MAGFIGPAVSIGSALFGGSQSSGGGTTQQSSASGYGALPSFDQQAIQQLISNAQGTLNAPGGTSIYTPLPQTASETTAQQLSQPMTQAGVTQLANNYLNPYQQYLTNAINQNAQAGNSMYQNQVSGSGFAPGVTNRDFLNEAYNQGQTNQAIGQSLANNYGAALQTGLGQQNTNVGQLMGVGANQRQIAAGTNQAPVTALQSLAQLMGVMPNTSTSQGTGTTASQSSSSPNGALNPILNGANSLSSFFGGSGNYGNLGTINWY